MVRPAVSVNTALPPRVPVLGLAVPLVATPGIGVPGSTGITKTLTALLTPLLAVMVKVSVVVEVAVRRWFTVGVKTNVPVAASTVTVPPPSEVSGPL